MPHNGTAGVDAVDGFDSIVVVSPENTFRNEIVHLHRFREMGLRHYNLRKPLWSAEQIKAFIESMIPSDRSCVVLHNHHELAVDAQIDGLHLRGASVASLKSVLPEAELRRIRSCSVHSLEELRFAMDYPVSVLFGPVFPSISKRNYNPAIDHDDLSRLLKQRRRSRVLALGGVDASRVAACRDIGFDGVAVHGAIWQASDPEGVFLSISRLCNVYFPPANRSFRR